MTKSPNILSDVAHLKGGYAFKSSDYTPSGRFILRTVNITDDGRIDRAGATFISEKDADEYSNFELEDGDTLFVMVGATLGKVGLVTANDLPALLNQNMWVIRAKDPDVTCKRYLNYWFKDTVKRTIQWASGSARGFVTRDDYRSLPFPSVKIETQRQIAQVLSILDAKIELNNRINVELAGMAKLLYDYWFVQFDFPMTAAQATTLGKPQLAGKPYRSSGGKMIYNEVLKREIPEVWEAKSLSQLVPVTKASVNPADFPDKLFKLFSIPVFDATGTYSLEKGSNVGSNKFIVTGNDILVSKLNPWFSRVIYSPEDIEAVCSTEFVVWQTITCWMKAFLFIVARSPQFVTFCTQSATGTSNSHKRVNPEVMMSHSIPWEPGQAQSFGEIVNPILLARQVNEIQNKELAQLRDWLLPMLMNGQVTVN